MQKQNSNTSKTVIETGKRHVQEDVYDVYSPDPNNPNSYDRTGKLKESWEVENTPDGIAVYNSREDDGRNVAEIVESGQGYQYDFEYNGKPRPFSENTRKELRGSNKLRESLKQDLKSLGIKVE
ncbi:hypothetical protein IC621_03155 [Bacillus sp. IB182487]|uniref:Uncharacterized protein n=2 Tax=Metabacillus arenae TaxID=2771434 RepID=A0A926RW59_9BACI|nr:hypothetical protein [Metabacillus arenae]